MLSFVEVVLVALAAAVLSILFLFCQQDKTAAQVQVSAISRAAPFNVNATEEKEDKANVTLHISTLKTTYPILSYHNFFISPLSLS